MATVTPVGEAFNSGEPRTFCRGKADGAVRQIWTTVHVLAGNKGKKRNFGRVSGKSGCASGFRHPPTLGDSRHGLKCRFSLPNSARLLDGHRFKGRAPGTPQEIAGRTQAPRFENFSIFVALMGDMAAWRPFRTFTSQRKGLHSSIRICNILVSARKYYSTTV
jgi:hypothetical protein